MIPFVVGVDLTCSYSADFGNEARVEWKFKNLQGSQVYIIFDGTPTGTYNVFDPVCLLKREICKQECRNLLFQIVLHSCNHYITLMVCHCLDQFIVLIFLFAYCPRDLMGC